MRNQIVFIGCVQEGKEALKEILSNNGNVVAILTFTDELAAKTSGAVPFDDISQKHNIPLYKIKGTKNEETTTLIQRLNPDTIFVVGWTRLIGKTILNIPRNGCIGLHASLLPKYRGRAPVNWVLIKGEKITGNTMMILDEGVDTGDIIAQRTIPINISDSCDSLYTKVGQAGREMIKEILIKLETNSVKRIKQNDDQATLMPKRTPEDGLIDWQKNGLEIFNWVRALTHPYPGAFTFYNDKKLFIWSVRLLHFDKEFKYTELQYPPGTIISVNDGLVVLTGGNDLISIHRLNVEGEQESRWDEFVKTHSMTKLEQFVMPTDLVEYEIN
jgi:methionyl-tRNA formyltransferase